jgi:3,4-dihydroxy 2-butanone 4-phosphate synthase/GTP cyclohydrolase II
MDSHYSGIFSSVDEIVEEACNGRMFVIVDDENSESEGNLCIPAQMATPDTINFMAIHGRGLICLALTESRTEQLGLDLMSASSATRNDTAFTISIEARDGVSTGISAADRARTISVAIDASNGPEHIVTPGHVFPLRAQSGGVLACAGHTEAAVDIARLAGLNPSGVICKILNDDGSIARLEDLVGFARRRALKIATIRDLIAFRLRRDHNLERAGERNFISRWGGTWRVISFRNKAALSENLAIVKGDIRPDKPVLVRMHGFDLFTDSMGQESDRADLLQKSMEMISREGTGVVVMLSRRTPKYISPAIEFLDHTDGDPELRHYGAGAQILSDLGVRKIILLTNTHHSYVALDGYDIDIVEERSL